MDALIRWFAEQWAEALAAALFAMTGEQAETCAGPRVEPPPEGFGWIESLTIAEGASVAVRLPAELSRSAGIRILQAAGLASEDSASARDAFMEVVRQSLAQFASKVGQRAGTEVTLKDGREVSDAPASFHWREVSLSLGGALPPCAIGISPELAAALAEDAGSTAAPHSGGEIAANGNQRSAERGEAQGSRNSKTLDLLLEVELPIGVSFGRTQMRVKDAMKLTTGSIVELNRSVTEPVEVIVNNCVIARGEVVVVEGNYGVRILEIISREERLRTLF